MLTNNTPLLIAIDYPEPDFSMRSMEGRRAIMDQVRKKFVTLTPEEWVRQNFIHYLIKVKQYPRSLMAVEKEIQLGNLKKRCDIVIYKNSIPWMIVECKEPNVSINEKTLRQILGYNMTLQASYLILTNGQYTYGIYRQGSSWNYISHLPEYK